MALNFRKFFSGINIVPRTDGATVGNSLGDLAVSTSDNNIYFNNGTDNSPLLTSDNISILVNNLTNANLSGSAGITNSNLAAMPSQTLKGNNTGSSGLPQDLTISQINAMLGTGGAAVTIGNLDAQSPNSQGQALVGGILSAQSADSTHPGLVNNVSQTFTGAKTFPDGVIGNVTGNTSGTASNVTGIITPDHGGTGIANNAAATTTRIGNFAKTETLTATTTVTYPQTGTLATLAGIETFSNKSFSDAITFQEITTPTSPSTGFNKVYPKSDGNFYNLSSTGIERKLGSGGGGSGGVNYITLDTSFQPNITDNSDAEGTIGNWAAFANTSVLASNNGTTNGDLGLSAGPGEWMGQSFLATGTGPLGSITIQLRTAIIGLSSGNMVLRLYSDSAGSPGTVLETSSAISSTILTTSLTSYTFNYTGTTTLTSGSTYYFFLDTSAMTYGGTVLHDAGTLASYAGGSSWATFNSGSTFTAQGGDAFFVITPSAFTPTLTGGSPTTTITRTTTSGQILDGLASFLMTKPASNLQGEGVSCVMNIPLGYRGQKSLITMPYRLLAGTLVSGDLQVLVYDITNSNLITPAASNVVGANGLIQSYFTVPPTCSQARIGFYLASNSTSAVTLAFDDVIIGPQELVSAPNITDPVSYVPTFVGAGTVTNPHVYYNQEGKYLFVKGTFISGTATATPFKISLPPGMIVDTTLIDPVAEIVGQITGDASGTTSGLSNIFGLMIQSGTSTSSVVMCNIANGTNTNNLVPVNGNSSFISTNRYSFYFKLPISGFSTNTVSANSRVFSIANILATGTKVSGTPPAVLGEYRAYYRATAGNNTLTDCGTLATPPSASNGIFIDGSVPGNSTGGSTNPQSYDIFIGKNKKYDIQWYATGGRTGLLSVGTALYNSGGNSIGAYMAYDPTMGILSINASLIYSGTETGRFLGDTFVGTAITPAATGFFDAIVSDNPLAVQFPNYSAVAPANWVSPAPTTFQQAIDRLAAVVSSNGSTPIP